MDPIVRMYKAMAEEAVQEVRNYHRPRMNFRASEVKDCRRAIYYRLSGYIPAPKSPTLRMYGIGGDAHHDVIRQMLKYHGVQLRDLRFEENGEVVELADKVMKFEIMGENFEVSSRADGGIFLEDLNDWALLEVKTLGFWKYKPMSDTFMGKFTDAEGNVLTQEAAVIAWMLRERPDFIHQSMLTAHMHGYSHVYILPKDRSDERLGVQDFGVSFEDMLAGNAEKMMGGILLQVSPEVVLMVLQKFASVKKYIDKGEPPRHDYLPGSKECTRCNFRYRCRDAEKRSAKGLVPTVVYPIEGVMDHASVDDNGGLDEQP